MLHRESKPVYMNTFSLEVVFCLCLCVCHCHCCVSSTFRKYMVWQVDSGPAMIYKAVEVIWIFGAEVVGGSNLKEVHADLNIWYRINSVNQISLIFYLLINIIRSPNKSESFTCQPFIPGDQEWLLIRVLLHEFCMQCATISYDRGKAGWWKGGGTEEKDDCLIIKIVSAGPCIAQRLPIPS